MGAGLVRIRPNRGSNGSRQSGFGPNRLLGGTSHLTDPREYWSARRYYDLPNNYFVGVGVRLGRVAPQSSVKLAVAGGLGEVSHSAWVVGLSDEPSPGLEPLSWQPESIWTSTSKRTAVDRPSDRCPRRVSKQTLAP